jgi:hypothetical protein
MKKVCASLCFVLFATAAVAGQYDNNDNSVVRWRRIAGVITAPNVDNPVTGAAGANGAPSTINAGTLPWTTNGGRARVDLSTGAVFFEVQGLVLNGGDFSGTLPPQFPNVVGTLVCHDAANKTTAVIDTPDLPLSPAGNAEFSGTLSGMPPSCMNPLFLIRVPAFGGKWIATGAGRLAGDYGR